MRRRRHPMTGYPKVYRENRARILASGPLCALCGRRKADTVDHIIEVDQGGGHEMSNLRPACKPCNSKRGARYVNAKTAAKRQAAARRAEAVELEEDARTAFFGKEAGTPRAIGRSIPPTQAKPSKAKRKQAAPSSTEPIRHDLPRLESPLPVGRSLGSEVAAWAVANLGIELMPWQRRALDGMLTLAADSPEGEMRLAHRYSLVSVARQQGKTTALKALVGWWLTDAYRYRGGPQVVITTAHALDLAYSLFQELAPVLEEKHGAIVKWSYGRNELKMRNGSTWLVRAATPSAGHGRSPDLVVIDELWDVSEETADNGLMPAQRARRYPLLAMWSTAGTESSRLMQRWRQQGLRAIDTGDVGPLYFAEWSPPPELAANAADPATWAWANPALGHTIDLDVLKAESSSPNRAAFLRGSLNLWVASDHAWLEPGLWETLRVDGDPPPVEVLAIDSAPDESRYVGIAAGMVDGRVHLRVAFITITEAEAWAEVRRLLGPSTLLAVTPTLDIHTPPEFRRKTTVGYGELLKWTSLMRAMIGEGRVVHGGDVALADHMARAVAVKTQAGVVLSSQRSPGPIELARCAVWATALASKARWSSKPTIGRSGANRPRPRS